MLYERIVSKLLFKLPPETAHRWAMRLVRGTMAVPPLGSMVARLTNVNDPSLEREVFGLRFPNPIGLAAGFDKNANYPDLIERVGFGFMEVGSVTAEPSAGNPPPRLFRLPEEQALINRMGLNNDGADVIAKRLASKRPRVDFPIFVNIARTPVPDPDEESGIRDYVTSVEKMWGVADAIVLNVSCPNTDDGRTFEDPASLDRLLGAVREALPPGRRPLLIKVSSDLDPGLMAESVSVTGKHEVDGLVAVNTTVDRGALTSTDAERLGEIGPGGLSGAPLLRRAIACVSRLYGLTGGRVPIIGVGGISTSADARAFLDAGASLVEVYTGFVYGGPLTAKHIAQGLRHRRAVPKLGEAVAETPS
jgi:dihydroorotate dehydrogenase